MKNAADKIRAVWKTDEIADESDWQAMVDEKEKERRIANRKKDR